MISTAGESTDTLAGSPKEDGSQPPQSMGFSLIGSNNSPLPPHCQEEDRTGLPTYDFSALNQALQGWEVPEDDASQLVELMPRASIMKRGNNLTGLTTTTSTATSLRVSPSEQVSNDFNSKNVPPAHSSQLGGLEQNAMEEYFKTATSEQTMLLQNGQSNSLTAPIRNSNHANSLSTGTRPRQTAQESNVQKRVRTNEDQSSGTSSRKRALEEEAEHIDMSGNTSYHKQTHMTHRDQPSNQNSSYQQWTGQQGHPGNQNGSYQQGTGQWNHPGDRNSSYQQGTGQQDHQGGQNSSYQQGMGRQNHPGGQNSFHRQGTGQWDHPSDQSSSHQQGTRQQNHPSGQNSFYRQGTGQQNQPGSQNSFYQQGTGQQNSPGGQNTFYQQGTGQQNHPGGQNTFYQQGTGQQNRPGGQNTFHQQGTGQQNRPGGQNTSYQQGTGQENRPGDQNSSYQQRTGQQSQAGNQGDPNQQRKGDIGPPGNQNNAYQPTDHQGQPGYQGRPNQHGQPQQFESYFYSSDNGRSNESQGDQRSHSPGGTKKQVRFQDNEELQQQSSKHISFQIPELSHLPKPKDVEDVFVTNDESIKGKLEAHAMKYEAKYDLREMALRKVTGLANQPGTTQAQFKQECKYLLAYDRDLRHAFQKLCNIAETSEGESSETDFCIDLPTFGDNSKLDMKDIHVLPAFRPSKGQPTLYTFWSKIKLYARTHNLTEQATKLLIAHRLEEDEAYNIFDMNQDQSLKEILRQLRFRYPSWPSRETLEEDKLTFKRLPKEPLQTTMNRYFHLLSQLYKKDKDRENQIELNCREMVKRMAYPAAREHLTREEKSLKNKNIRFTYQQRLEILNNEEELIRKREAIEPMSINTFYADELNSHPYQEYDLETIPEQNMDYQHHSEGFTQAGQGKFGPGEIEEDNEEIEVNPKIYSAIKRMLENDQAKPNKQNRRDYNHISPNSRQEHPTQADKMAGNLQKMVPPSHGQDSKNQLAEKYFNIIQQNKNKTVPANSRQEQRTQNWKAKEASKRTAWLSEQENHRNNMAMPKSNNPVPPQTPMGERYPNQRQSAPITPENRQQWQKKIPPQIQRKNSQSYGQGRQPGSNNYGSNTGGGNVNSGNTNNKLGNTSTNYKNFNNSIKRNNQSFPSMIDYDRYNKFRPYDGHQSPHSEPEWGLYGRDRNQKNFREPMISENARASGSNGQENFKNPFYRKYNGNRSNVNWGNRPPPKYEEGQNFQGNYRQGIQKNRSHIRFPKLMQQTHVVRPDSATLNQYFDIEAQPCMYCARTEQGSNHTVAECPKRRSPEQRYATDT